MKDIDDIINEMNIDDLENLKFSYSDIILIEQSDIDTEHPNYWLWKYYTGNITIDEHKNLGVNLPKDCYNAYTVYTIIFFINQFNGYEDIYICSDSNPEFAFQDSNNNDFKAIKDYDCFSNEVTDLWLMKPEKFQYEEDFKKLIFMLYLFKREERFRQIALDFYKSNEDASKCLNKYNSKEDASKYVDQYNEHMFLIYRKNDCNYKKHYAIEECKSEEYNYKTDNKIDEINNNQNEDWITKRFGGTK